MLRQYQGFITLLGRLLLTPIFLKAAYSHLTDFAGTKGYMAHNLPLPDGVLTFLLAGACAFLVLGGLSVLFGYQARVGALLLVLFLIPVTIIMHNFWAANPDQVMSQTMNFAKNFTIAGGLLFIMAYGAGPWSLDGARAEKLK
jgi:putative oxidoreductase